LQLILQIFQINQSAKYRQTSADDKLAVTIGDDGAARVWSTEDGRLIRLVRGHGDLVTRTVMSNDGVLVTAALDGSVRVSRDLAYRRVMFPVAACGL
jgi:WD40 repeat protein